MTILNCVQTLFGSFNSIASVGSGMLSVIERTGRVGPGRAGSGWFITAKGSTSKNNKLPFREPHSLNQYFTSLSSAR